MRIDVLTKEYPPAIYGGAGVHAAELVRALRDLPDTDVRVRCFGADRDEEGTTAYPDPAELADANGALTTMGVDLAMADDAVGADLVHSHTWYANFAGHVASLLGGMPHVITAPAWSRCGRGKAEQLGGGYQASSWIEKTAYEAAAGVIAVSDDAKDILRSIRHRRRQGHVVHNGIDSELWARTGTRHPPQARRRSGPAAVILSAGSPGRRGCCTSCGRRGAAPEVQLILCAGAPDTPEIKAEVEGLIDELKTERDGVVWIGEMRPATGRRPALRLDRVRLPVGL